VRGAIVGAIVGGFIVWLFAGVPGPFSPKSEVVFATKENPVIPESLKFAEQSGENFTIYLKNNGSAPSGPIQIVVSQPPLEHTVPATFLPPPGEKLDQLDRTGRFSIAVRPLEQAEVVEIVVWGGSSAILENVLSGSAPVKRVDLIPQQIGQARPFSVYIYFLATIVGGIFGVISGLAFSRGYREAKVDYVEIYEQAKSAKTDTRSGA